jgi:hypothetical protein
LKKYLIGITLILGLSNGLAQAQMPSIDLSNVMKAFVAADIAQTQANLINWKVGDYHKIKVEFLFGGGKGSKEATKEDKERNGVWLETKISLMGQDQKTEVLYDRASGKVLEVIVNGEPQEQGGEDSEFEIIEQKETEVTVPAGKFECMYIKAKTVAQGQETTIQAWLNPVDVVLDGMLKVVFDTQMGPLTMLLEKFGTKN